jgi:hypothetical protein
VRERTHIVDLETKNFSKLNTVHVVDLLEKGAAGKNETESERDAARIASSIVRGENARMRWTRNTAIVREQR